MRNWGLRLGVRQQNSMAENHPKRPSLAKVLNASGLLQSHSLAPGTLLVISLGTTSLHPEGQRTVDDLIIEIRILHDP